MPTWFLLLFAFCAGWVANVAVQIFRGKEAYVAGQRANRSVTAPALAIIIIAVALAAAVQLGLIPDHAP